MIPYYFDDRWFPPLNVSLAEEEIAQIKREGHADLWYIYFGQFLNKDLFKKMDIKYIRNE